MDTILSIGMVALVFGSNAWLIGLAANRLIDINARLNAIDNRLDGISEDTAFTRRDIQRRARRRAHEASQEAP